MEEKPRVALGMSGGVDSSVAVAVLQHHGYDVLGVTCLFDRTEKSMQAARDAAAVCARFDIEHVVHDCAAVFEERVVAPFVDAYRNGLTPSPCVGCNARMKIPALLDVAAAHGCAQVATGHYARVNRMQDSGRYAVLAALDHRKDQSYMLALLSQEQLARLVLPLGGMTKLEVRAFAADLGLEVADTPDSQDICFAPHGYRTLLAQRGVVEEPGDIVNRAGEVLGRHAGLSGYTVGQRRGIGVAGPEPYYVIEKRATTRELVIGTEEESRIGSVLVRNVNWQAVAAPGSAQEAMVKLRYRSTACACIIEPVDERCVRAMLLSSQPATAPGQYAVFYQGSVVLGGGMIEEVRS